MHIPSLPQELLEKVLLLCSVEDVHSLSRTCKGLNESCQSRSIWTRRLFALEDDEVPNLPPHIPFVTLSTPRLRILVTHAAWRKHAHASRSPFLPYAHVDLLTNLPLSANAALPPQLLPGGEYVLLSCAGKIELWSINEQKRLFRTSTIDESDCCSSFSFNLVGYESENEGEDDSAIEVLIAVVFVREDTSAYLSVFSYELANSEGKVLLRRDIPFNFLWRPVVSERMVLMHNASLMSVILIDCETHMATTIDFAPTSRPHWNPGKALISDKLLIATLVVDDSYMLASISLSSIGSRWSPNPSFEHWPKLKFVYHPERNSDLAENEVTGEVLRLWEYTAANHHSQWAAKMQVSVPTWRKNRSARHGRRDTELEAEIYLLKTVPDDPFSISGSAPRTLVSTRVIFEQVHLSEPGTLSLHSAHTQIELKKSTRLALLSTTSSSTGQMHIPWQSASITQSGRMLFAVGKSIFCSSLRSKDGDLQPRKVLDIGEELENGATIFNVESWSEDILVGYPGRLSALRLRKKKS